VTATPTNTPSRASQSAGQAIGEALEEESPPGQRAWVGWFLAISATAAFSLAPPLGRGAIEAGHNPTVLLVGRMMLATVLLGATIALTKPKHLIADRRCFLIATGAGSVNTIGMLAFFWALTRIEASMASMIVTLNPLVVLSLLALRGERVTYRHGVRLVLGIVGVYLLIGPGGEADLIGVGLTFVALLSFAMQLVTIQWYLRDYDARTVTFYVLLAMTVGVIISWIVEGAQWQPLGLYGWLAVAVMAVVSTYYSRLALFAAISRIGSGQMAFFSPLETLLTVVWSYLFLGERLSALQYVGGLLILISSALAIQRIGRAKWRPRWRVWARS
jgi:drug/metabolite transporter (DMT)-like permease